MGFALLATAAFMLMRQMSLVPAGSDAIGVHGLMLALAVAGDRLVFVGDEAGVDAYVGAATRTVDARGRLVLPGFHDSHVHPIIAWEVRSERRSENAGLTLAVNC